jgi:multiple sugar transport system substrate-binding protein
MDTTSRRGFLELAALGAVGAALGPRRVSAQTKSLTFLHESSFIKTYDEYFQKVLAPAYEKETGIKVTYELTSVGSLQTRVTTVAETGSGADITANAFSWPFLFDEKYLDVSDIAEEAGKRQGGWYDAAKEAVFVTPCCWNPF